MNPFPRTEDPLQVLLHPEPEDSAPPSPYKSPADFDLQSYRHSQLGTEPGMEAGEGHHAKKGSKLKQLAHRLGIAKKHGHGVPGSPAEGEHRHITVEPVELQVTE